MKERHIDWNRAKRAILTGSSDFLDLVIHEPRITLATLKTLEFGADLFAALCSLEIEDANRQFGLDSQQVDGTIFDRMTTDEWLCENGHWKRISK